MTDQTPASEQPHPFAARDAEIALLVEESAYWKDLYESYCAPEDVRAMQDERDKAVERAAELEGRLEGLIDENVSLRTMLKERSDWSQRVWLAWCSARERARAVPPQPEDRRDD